MVFVVAPRSPHHRQLRGQLSHLLLVSSHQLPYVLVLHHDGLFYSEEIK